MAGVRYIVDDVHQAIAFYTSHLDFELVQQFGPAMAILAKGDLRLWVAGPQASASKPMPDGSTPVPGGWNRIVVTVTQIEEQVAKLREAGIVFRNDIIQGPGGRQILCEDPAGNPIELFEPA